MSRQVIIFIWLLLPCPFVSADQLPNCINFSLSKRPRSIYECLLIKWKQTNQAFRGMKSVLFKRINMKMQVS